MSGRAHGLPERLRDAVVVGGVELGLAAHVHESYRRCRGQRAHLDAIRESAGGRPQATRVVVDGLGDGGVQVAGRVPGAELGAIEAAAALGGMEECGHRDGRAARLAEGPFVLRDRPQSSERAGQSIIGGRFEFQRRRRVGRAQYVIEDADGGPAAGDEPVGARVERPDGMGYGQTPRQASR
jgi:hypothetical protein